MTFSGLIAIGIFLGELVSLLVAVIILRYLLRWFLNVTGAERHIAELRSRVEHLEHVIEESRASAIEDGRPS